MPIFVRLSRKIKVNNVSLGLYISVPFCRTKCSYCNFASDVFSKTAYENYVVHLLEEIHRAPQTASELGCSFEPSVDTVYLGGGTPSVLDSSQLQRIFDALRAYFKIALNAEITVECAPGTLNSAMIDSLVRCGVNRISLGVQSFVDKESAAVGRLHKRATVLDEIVALRHAGIANINVDLIAGLPHQTSESWEFSLCEVISIGVPHVSVYMLEVDEDSRLGRELMAGGTRYHAHFVPDDEATAVFYLRACEVLDEAGVSQYEISNFAREAGCSRHNLKYWTRQPYLGFGVDAHSMLQASAGNHQAVRFSTPDSLDGYLNGASRQVTPVSESAALEEAFFLGLRLNEGIDLAAVADEFGAPALAAHENTIEECVQEELLERVGARIRLTARGRLLSNEVFARFLREDVQAGTGHA